MTPQNDIEVLKLKLDAVAETVIQLASHITAKDNVVTCPFCQERILRTPSCPFCLEKQTPGKQSLRNKRSRRNKGTRRQAYNMANWKYKVDIKSIWNDEGTTVAEKGKLIAGVLRQTFPYAWFLEDNDAYDEELDGIYQDFLDVGRDDSDPVDYFDDVMNRLYDYGDMNVPPFNTWPPHKMAWIGTSL